MESLFTITVSIVNITGYEWKWVKFRANFCPYTFMNRYNFC